MLRASRGIPSGGIARKDSSEEEWLIICLLCGAGYDPSLSLYIQQNLCFM